MDAMDPMRETARELVAPGKGILAADESGGTIKKRFDQIGVDSTEQSRRDYRQLLFTTPGLGEHISGVILFDETIRQSTDDGTPLTDVLEKAGVIAGIKVDAGAKPLALFEGETVTEGLDGLRERLTEYRELGARFAKWRATYFIGDDLPSDFAVLANGHAMARYAALCEEAGIVPIVEPEVLMDGDHDLAACEAATGRALQVLYAQMTDHRVDLTGTLLKVNMVVPGKGAATQVDDTMIAEATLRTLRAHVPEEVPGIVFLSGGMTDEEATSRLNEINRQGGAPWGISFSYGRALQQGPLKAWGGSASNVEAAQAALAHRARMNGLARNGEWSPSMEESAA
ncbi:MAG TPA: class I fructose-bisphosphate aldolase [Actinomycetota bacterium]|nr:class I fructose-bisphosphate aldolase [Actinomycetota bacterium]